MVEESLTHKAGQLDAVLLLLHVQLYERTDSPFTVSNPKLTPSWGMKYHHFFQVLMSSSMHWALTLAV